MPVTESLDPTRREVRREIENFFEGTDQLTY
jgi:hypothetical protein